jgi:hypothetical protein
MILKTPFWFSFNIWLCNAKMPYGLCGMLIIKIMGLSVCFDGR